MAEEEAGWKKALRQLLVYRTVKVRRGGQRHERRAPWLDALARTPAAV